MLTFLRPLFHLEFPGDPAGAPPPVGEPAGEPQGEPQGEPAWTGPSRDEWGSVLGFIQQQQQERAAYEQQQAAQYQQQQEPQHVQLDPFADNFGEQLSGFFQDQLQQHLSPVQQFIQEQQMGEGEERALDILEDVVSKDGDFLDNERAFASARALANVYFAEEVQRHGYGPAAAEAALVRAAGEVRAYEQHVREQALSQHSNHLATLTGAATEPGSVYGQGFQERQVPDYRGEGGTVSGRMFGGR